jgi:ribosome-binding protein aMBF1 (putative translation factor)
MTPMTTTTTPGEKTFGTLVAEESLRDPQFRQEWEETALARFVAVEIIRYRAQHKLSQRKLAETLGVKQPFVSRLESGEHNPDLATLVRVSRTLGIEFLIDIRPEERKTPKLVTKRVAQEQSTHTHGGVAVVLAAAS